MSLKHFVVLVLFISSAACAPAGGIKPTMWSTPPSYLSSFPLGSVTADEMILKAGPPDNTLKISGKDAMVYRFGEAYGKKSWTYLLEDSVIVDVVYNDAGSFNGVTAKQYQVNK